MRLTWPAKSGDWRLSLIVSMGFRAPLPLPRRPVLVQRGQEVGELFDLLRRQFPEGGHDARADFDRADDRSPRDPGGDVGQFGTWAVVAVLAELVAGEAAGSGDDLLAFLVLGRHLHVDLGRRAAGGAEVGQVAHRDDRQAAGGGGDRAPVGPALRAAVVERQQQEQDHADGRDADRRNRDQLRRLDHAQDLEEEVEVPLGARHVGGGGRIGLRALLGAEDQRHRDDHGDDDQRHHRVFHHRVGEERLPLLLQKLVLLEVFLLVLRLHADDAPLPPSPETGAPSTRLPLTRPLPLAPASSWASGEAPFGRSALIHGGAVVPSLTTRYMWAPIRAMSAPGTNSMWMA